MVPLWQKSANYGPWDKFSLPAVLTNKVLLEHSNVSLFTIVYDIFCTTVAELSNCHGVHMAWKAKLSVLLQTKLVKSCIMVKRAYRIQIITMHPTVTC